MDGNKKANIRFLVVLIITALIGGAHILLCGVDGAVVMITAYIVAMAGAIPMIWFSYSAAKWHNKRHAYLHERDVGGGEPSEWGILRMKISGWSLYLVGLLLSLLPLILK